MMYVRVKTSFEAMHCWPQAPDIDSYLSAPHRHLFTVDLRLEVKHDDRDIEINALKRWIDKYVKYNITDAPFWEGKRAPQAVGEAQEFGEVPNLGALSCEQIATRIASAVRARFSTAGDREIWCEVLEDGLLGGGVTFP